jgi:XTP/dITP diphosphohydrolase
MDLIISSNNKNKINEIKKLLSSLDINVLSLSDINFNEEILETGSTFSQNSYIKAKTIFDKYHMPVIADDSGLEVEALGGKPGVYSHRYAGEDCNDTANNLKLIEELNGVLNRNANYTCDICYINKDGQVKHSTGKCYGLICNNPKGENGFGYDPYFYIESLGKTMAELDMDEKNKISHRAKALNQLKELIYEDLTSK